MALIPTETNRVFESNTRIPCIIVIVPGSTLSHTEYISVEYHIHTSHIKVHKFIITIHNMEYESDTSLMG
jgi:hypothetical protein